MIIYIFHPLYLIWDYFTYMELDIFLLFMNLRFISLFYKAFDESEDKLNVVTNGALVERRWKLCCFLFGYSLNSLSSTIVNPSLYVHALKFFTYVKNHIPLNFTWLSSLGVDNYVCIQHKVSQS